MPAATLIQHRHCPTCGKAILPSRITCEGDCEVTYAKTKRGKRLFWVAWMGFTLVIVLVYVSLAKASPL